MVVYNGLECIESHPSHLTESRSSSGHSCGRDVRQRLLKEADRQAGFISVETGTTVETAANVAHALVFLNWKKILAYLCWDLEIGVSYNLDFIKVPMTRLPRMPFRIRSGLSPFRTSTSISPPRCRATCIPRTAFKPTPPVTSISVAQ